MKEDYLFGLLTYPTNNLGDEIQSIAARQFLPRVDLYIDREYDLDKVKSEIPIKLIMNGWFKHNVSSWPPSPSIRPLFISFHITPLVSDKLMNKHSVSYLSDNAPIGCRDFFTLQLLKKYGIDSYFSGCLTLTLGYNLKIKNNSITDSKKRSMIIDLDKNILKIMPKQLLEKFDFGTHTYLEVGLQQKIIKRLSHSINRSKYYKKHKNSSWLKEIRYILGGLSEKSYLNKLKIKKRSSNVFNMAENCLYKYMNAKLVLTSRLHVALPCIAFKTPMIFIKEDVHDDRFKGYEDILNIITPVQFLRLIKDYKSLEEYAIEKNMLSENKVAALKKDMISRCENFINC